MQRRISPEILDHASDADLAASLGDLDRLHRWFGGDRIAVSLLGRFVLPAERFTLLDLGAASGHLSHIVTRAFPNATVVSLDRHLRSLRRTPSPRVAADAFEPPFADRSFDIVHCSLLLHHFEEAAVVNLLRTMHRLARRAAIAVDLERHPIARGFLPWTRWAFGWNRVTLHDGPISVDAAFTRAELRELGRRAGLESAVVRRHLPWFRLSLTAPRLGSAG